VEEPSQAGDREWRCLVEDIVPPPSFPTWAVVNEEGENREGQGLRERGQRGLARTPERQRRLKL